MRIHLLLPALAMGLSLRADTIVFKNGQTLDGKVIKKDDVNVELEVKFGTMLVPVAKILAIEEDTPEKILEREAREAEEKELAEQMKADGKVKHKGKWITEAEKEQQEQKAKEERKKRDAAREQERKKAEQEAARKKQDAEKKKQELAKQYQQWVQQQQQQQQQDFMADRFNSRHGRYNEGTRDNFRNGGGRNNSYGGGGYGGGQTFQDNLRRYGGR